MDKRENGSGKGKEFGVVKERDQTGEGGVI